MFSKLQKCVESIRKITDFAPEIAIVLGSGLGEYADKIQKVCEISYSEIENFPTSTVQGHQGKFVFGYVEKVPVVIMQGRVHHYEGYEMSDVVLPIRVMGLLGAKKLILTNAAGGISDNFSVGDFVLISDHITFFIKSALIGKNIDELGVRFPDMTQVYSKTLRETLKTCGVPLKEGVYAQLTGPQYETPAEIRALKTMGADLVGMSTACEAMVARHMGIEVVGISLVTNMAAGINKTQLSHSEVQETAERAKKDFEKLITNAVLKIGG